MVSLCDYENALLSYLQYIAKLEKQSDVGVPVESKYNSGYQGSAKT